MEKPLQWIQLSPGQSLSFPPLLQGQPPGLDQSGGGRTIPAWPAIDGQCPRAVLHGMALASTLHGDHRGGAATGPPEDALGEG